MDNYDSNNNLSNLMSKIQINKRTVEPGFGGVLIIDKQTEDVIGAVGVQGASHLTEDEFLAIKGVKHNGLVHIGTLPENHKCTTCKEVQNDMPRTNSE
jgi:uncharacterized protein GlcG (DUF336 family)